MYRALFRSGDADIYCNDDRCGRDCGRIHPYFVNETRAVARSKQPMKTTSKSNSRSILDESTDSGVSGVQFTPVKESTSNGSQSRNSSLSSATLQKAVNMDSTPSTSRMSPHLPAPPPAQTTSTSLPPVNDVFAQIMQRAENMPVPPGYEEPPLPPAPNKYIQSARAHSRKRKAITLQRQDTTQVNYDDRPHSSSSDDEYHLSAAPPSQIDDEESSVDNLLRDVKSGVDTNPLFHTYEDENVFGNDDDFVDDLDLGRKLSIESHSSARIYLPQRRPAFEKGLFESSLDFPSLPPTPTTQHHAHPENGKN